MGYCIELKECKFLIKKDNKAWALNLLKEYITKTKRWNLTRISPSDVLVAETFETALYACRWECILNKEGDIISLYFNGEKLGDEEEMFKAISPAVENNSYIEIKGEENLIWRWVFEKGKCKEETI